MLHINQRVWVSYAQGHQYPKNLLDGLISVVAYGEIVGYSSLMEEDERLALSRLTHFEQAIRFMPKDLPVKSMNGVMMDVLCFFRG